MKKYFFTFLFLCYGVLFATDNVVGTTIPDLKLNLLDGERTSIHELLKDGPVMIDFWATWVLVMVPQDVLGGKPPFLFEAHVPQYPCTPIPTYPKTDVSSKPTYPKIPHTH